MSFSTTLFAAGPGRWPALALLLAAPACTPAAPAEAPGPGRPATYATDRVPREVRVADLNGDGRPDLVTINEGTSHTDEAPSILLPGWVRRFIERRREGQPNEGSVSVRFGQAGGQLGPRTDYAVGQYPQTLALADVTGDGHPDVVVTSWLMQPGAPTEDDGLSSDSTSTGAGGGLGGTVTVLPALASHAALGPRRDYAMPLVRAQTALADLDGDGRPDLLLPGDNTLTLDVLPGRAGGFGPVRRFPADSLGAEYVTVADANGDGRPDVLLGSYFFGSATVLLAAPGGGFGRPTTYKVESGHYAGRVLLGDATADGRPDLVQGYDSGVAVLPGLGNGRFGPPRHYLASPQTYGAALADVTGDGRPDYVTSSQPDYEHDAYVAVQPGLPGGGFGPPVRVLPLSAYCDLVVADLTGDGVPDIVAIDQGTSEVRVLPGPVVLPPLPRR